MKSYVNVRLSILSRIRELAALHAMRRERRGQEVAQLIQGVQEHSARIETLLGEPLRGKQLLEVGPGQLLKRARIFGARNHVSCIDLDELPAEDMAGLLKSWSVNGSTRTLKTLGRRMLGMDRDFLRELFAAMPEARHADVKFYRRDATRTEFADGSFDVTVSNSVLEHIPDPKALVKEMVRITRRGGVFSHIVHSYTSDSGAHDPRSFRAQHPDFPYWCHLRPAFQHLSVPNCYLNKWRLADWLAMFEEQLPGASIEKLPGELPPHIAEAFRALRQDRELPDYSDDELTVEMLLVSWRKP